MSRTQYVKISDAAKQELREATHIALQNNPKGECELVFREGIKKYAELKKLFPELGITWDKKDKKHYGKAYTLGRITEILGGGKIVDEKKTLQAFYTPHDLVKRVVKLADVKTQICLEPSCGDGRIIAEMLEQGARYVLGVDIIKTAPQDATYWNSSGKVDLELETDFLSKTPHPSFECVVMNPPYDKNTWIKHICHAWDFLEEKWGKLVAICPHNESNKQLQKFLEDKNYNITPIEAGAFKESGTMIATMILEVWK